MGKHDERKVLMMFENVYVKLDDVLDELDLSVRVLRRNGEDAAAEAVETEIINMQRLERRTVYDEPEAKWEGSICSNCGGDVISEGENLDELYKYCPYCGARVTSCDRWWPGE